MALLKSFPKFTLIYLIVMAVEIAGLTVIPTFHIVSKAFIIASLIGFYITTERRQNNAFLTGMIFALLGDCFLLFETADFFTIGLICFLVMQICYTLAFNRKRRIPKNKDLVISALIAIMGLSIILSLWGSLGAMQIPVTIYGSAITVMGIFAYLRHPQFRGYRYVLVGVGFFFLSDLLLAYNKFVTEIAYGQFAVMITYMIAQYLIVTGEVLDRIPTEEKTNPFKSNLARHKA